MNNNTKIYLLLFLFIFLIIVSCIIYININKFENTHSYDGVCALDLDGTITCGIYNAKKAIQICKDANYKIAINTARPSKYYSDIKLDLLGLKESDFIDDFYYGETLKCSFGDYQCLENNISATKLKHLITIENKWKVPRNKIILFDDVYQNVKIAEDNGFSVIYANNPACGINENFENKLYNIINS